MSLFGCLLLNNRIVRLMQIQEASGQWDDHMNKMAKCYDKVR